MSTGSLAPSAGTHPTLIEFTDDPNRTIDAAERYLREAKLTEPGDNLVILSDVRAGDELVDCVQLRPVKN